MRPIDLDNIPTIEGDEFVVRPWIDPHPENLNRVTIPDRIKHFNDGWYNLLYQDCWLIYPRTTSDFSAAPRDNSSMGSLFSFSTEAFSDFKNKKDRKSDSINQLWDRISSNIFLQSPEIQSDVFTGQTDTAFQINNAIHHHEIFNILSFKAHQKIADRLKYLHEITQDDDPEDPAMKFLSLREFAIFFIDEGNSLPYPQIGINPNGLLQAEWRSKKASAVMKFLTDGSTRFAGTMVNQDVRNTIQGSGTKKHALKSILPFIKYSYRSACPV